MASKTEERPQKEEMPEKEGPETLPDSPLLDLSDAAVKKLIRSAKKRGYVTHDQINSMLPSREVNSEQITNPAAKSIIRVTSSELIVRGSTRASAIGRDSDRLRQQA